LTVFTSVIVNERYTTHQPVRGHGDHGCYTGGDGAEHRQQEAAELQPWCPAARASSGDDEDDVVRRLVPCQGDGGGVEVVPEGSAVGTARRDPGPLPDHTMGTLADHSAVKHISNHHCRIYHTLSTVLSLPTFLN